MDEPLEYDVVHGITNLMMALYFSTDPDFVGEIEKKKLKRRGYKF